MFLKKRRNDYNTKIFIITNKQLKSKCIKKNQKHYRLKHKIASALTRMLMQNKRTDNENLVP